MVTIAMVCQSKVSLILVLDGLCNGAKTISIQLKGKKIHILEWKTTLRKQLIQLTLTVHGLIVGRPFCQWLFFWGGGGGVIVYFRNGLFIGILRVFSLTLFLGRQQHSLFFHVVRIRTLIVGADGKRTGIVVRSEKWILLVLD